jgi:hypothetical protein
MRNSSKKIIRELGKSNTPAQIVVFTSSIFRIVNDRMEGMISDEQCFEDIAKSGVSIVGTSKAGLWGGAAGKKIGKKIGGAIGNVIGPAGAIVSSMIAGVILDVTFDYAVQQIKAPNLAKKERLLLEEQCEKLHRELEAYRQEFRNTYIANTNELSSVFGSSLKTMAEALKMNDADSFIFGANIITTALDGKIQFSTVDEFIGFLDSDDALTL